MIKYFLFGFLIFNIAWAQTASEVYLRRYQAEQEILGEVKFSLINGNTDHGKLLLIKNRFEIPHNILIAKRYKSIIHFIEENFKKSLSELKDPLFYEARHFAQICHLLVLNMVLENQDGHKTFWDRCRRIIRDDMTTSNYWMDAIITLKEKKHPDFVRIPDKNIKQFDGNDLALKAIFKMGLYLNRHQNFVKDLYKMDETVLNNPELREILSYMLFRDYDLVKAVDIAQGLDSANIHNMNGNINLLKKQKEQAFAEFKLALKKKRNSINAMERLIPLAWQLEQDDFLLEVVKSYNKFYPKDATPKVYQAAVLVKKKDYKKAERIMRETLVYAPNAPKSLANSLISFVDWKRGYFHKALKRYGENCQKLNQSSCLLYSLDILWNKMFIKDRPIDQKLISPDISIVDRIIEKDFKDPIEEKIYIDQRQIDEMDNSLIRLKGDVAQKP